MQQQNIALNNGTFSLTLEPGYLYSLSTTSGQHKGSAVGPKSAPLGLHYQENFDSYATGKLAHYFSDINGAFETAAAGGGRSGNVYRQVITTAPIAWVKWSLQPRLLEIRTGRTTRSASTYCSNRLVGLNYLDVPIVVVSSPAPHQWRHIIFRSAMREPGRCIESMRTAIKRNWHQGKIFKAACLRLSGLIRGTL